MSGGVCFSIDVDGDDVEALVKVGALDEARRHAHSAVRAAVMRLSAIGFRALKAETSR